MVPGVLTVPATIHHWPNAAGTAALSGVPGVRQLVPSVQCSSLNKFQSALSFSKTVCYDRGIYCRKAAEALKARAALGYTPSTLVFLGLIGPSRRS